MVAYAKGLAGNKKVKLPPGFAGVDTPDPLTVVFCLQWPDAAMLANFASRYQIAGWVLFTHHSNIASNSASLSSSIAFLGGAYVGLIP